MRNAFAPYIEVLRRYVESPGHALRALDGLAEQVRELDRQLNEERRSVVKLSEQMGRLTSIVEGLVALEGTNHQGLSVDIAALEYGLSDLREWALASRDVPQLEWRLIAQRSLAALTSDHLRPRGTKNDNTRHPAFVTACERLLSHSPIRHLDLGCAGGGLVWDFVWRGHLSVGIEGSDYSLRRQRAEWRTIPGHLFTADICYPFYFEESGSSVQVEFDVISAWEVFEHIPTAQLDGLFENIHRNLRPGGYVAASVATFPDVDPSTGAVYHHTVEPRSWWIERFAESDFEMTTARFPPESFARGSGNVTSHDWDVSTDPDRGFHVVLQPRSVRRS